MAILVAGVRQKTASIDIREQFALTESEIETASSLLMALPGIEECAILSTCNRTEIYACVTNTHDGLQSVKRFFKDLKDVDYDHFYPAVFTLLDEDAIMHLFRVASGLDSLILGEGQILAQVKDTLNTAQRLKTTGIVLDRLFKSALSIGKRIRTETGIAQKDVSVSRAAFEFARQQVPDLLNQRIALVGGGKMASILLASLRRTMTEEQRRRVVILNRSESRLKSLVEKFGFSGATWDAADEVIETSDVLFVATGAPHIVFWPENFENRGNKWIIDISVPRNVDPAVGDLPTIQLFNTDNLAGIEGFSPETQQQILDQAQRLIAEGYVSFLQWHESLRLIPAISQLRDKVEHIRKAEIDAITGSMKSNIPLIDELSRNLINKILHEPIVRLKSAHNAEQSSMQVKMLMHLFNIADDSLPPAVT